MRETMVNASRTTNGGEQAAKILVVDDDRNLTGVITEYLTWCGFQATQVNMGHEACEFLATQPVDLVLLDVELPDLSGLKVCQWMREQTNLRHLPVIFCTGSLVAPADIVNIEAELIYKPFQMETLMEAVQRNLDRHQPVKLAADDPAGNGRGRMCPSMEQHASTSE